MMGGQQGLREEGWGSGRASAARRGLLRRSPSLERRRLARVTSAAGELGC